MKTYEEYKDSGIEWIGEIPEYWEVKRLKYIAKVQNSNVDKKKNENELGVLLCNYIDVYNNEFIDSHINFLEASATIKEIDKFRIDNEDVLVTKDSEDPNDIAIPALVNEHFENVICGYHLTQIKPTLNILTGSYLFRLFQSCKFNAQFIVSANGVTRYGLSIRSIANAFIPILPIEEQTQIAKYLDYKTSLLDKLIEKNEKLIELLEEKRSAIINQAVTKGLNPVKMKNSGIEWIGEIPEHWGTKMIKHAIYLQRGHDLSSDKFVEGQYPVYGSNGIIGYHNEYTSIGPSITIGRSGSIGEVNYIEDNFWAHNTTLYAKRLNDIFAKYAFYIFHVVQTESVFSGSAVGTLNRNYIHAMKFVFPPIIEQTQIAKYLDYKTSLIDKLVTDKRKSNEYLKEYRATLISNVVTGKVDVREEKVPENFN